MAFLTSSIGVPRLISGPSSPIIWAVFAASSDTWSAGFASIFLERSFAAEFVESEYGRHCDGEDRAADRASHCPCGFGRSGIDRARDITDSRGGMALLCLALLRSVHDTVTERDSMCPRASLRVTCRSAIAHATLAKATQTSS
jgi:hypothetical protein